MTQTYTKGSNPYFEYAMLKYSQVAVIERMQKDDVLEHIKTLDFQSVANVWELIHTHLENVNLSLNAYNYSNYTLPTTEKPISKFDFITKNSKAMGAYQSGVLVNDFSYFVDSNTIAKSKANEFSQRKYELLHKVSAFTHLENKAELASVEARKAFFEAFLTILHKLHNADFEEKLNQINAELAPHLFVPEKYIRLENRQKMVAVTTYSKRWQVGGDSYRTSHFNALNELLEPFTAGHNLSNYTQTKDLVSYGFYLNQKKNILYLCIKDNNRCGIIDRLINSPTTTHKTFNYMIEVEYQTQYGKDKLPNETPPATPYKIKKLNGSWVTHDNKPLDTAGKSEDEILQM